MTGNGFQFQFDRKAHATQVEGEKDKLHGDEAQ